MYVYKYIYIYITDMYIIYNYIYIYIYIHWLSEIHYQFGWQIGGTIDLCGTSPAAPPSLQERSAFDHSPGPAVASCPSDFDADQSPWPKPFCHFWRNFLEKHLEWLAEVVVGLGFLLLAITFFLYGIGGQLVCLGSSVSALNPDAPLVVTWRPFRGFPQGLQAMWILEYAPRGLTLDLLIRSVYYNYFLSGVGENPWLQIWWTSGRAFTLTWYHSYLLIHSGHLQTWGATKPSKPTRNLARY